MKSLGVQFNFKTKVQDKQEVEAGIYGYLQVID